jgi:L,D-transpeptidase ErfK/SrfK
MTRAACFAVAGLLLWRGAGVVAQEAPPLAVLTGGEAEYVVARGDSLTSVAARFGVGVETLREINHLDRQGRLMPGQALVIVNRHIAAIGAGERLAINIAQRMLFLAEGGVVRGYPITVGRPTWPTPVGAFTVIEKEENPSWDVPVSIQQEMRQQGKPVITKMSPSPDNPLGAHWLRLSFPGLGIHGTNVPTSIYRYASHGCIRMHPDDVAEVFARVGVGVEGRISYQPVLIAVIEGRVFLESHPDAYRRSRDSIKTLRLQAQASGFEQLVDWSAAAIVLGQRRGLAVDVTLKCQPR